MNCIDARCCPLTLCFLLNLLCCHVVTYCCHTVMNCTNTCCCPLTLCYPVEEQAGSSDVERDASRVTSLPPAAVHLPAETSVIQIACGLHHTVLLLQSGEVMAFGSNTYGQLGVGDLLPRGGPTLVKLACHTMHVAAGSNHTVVLSNKGEVYTFGNYQV